MLHKHCIFIPFDGFENLKFFSQFCEKIKPDPILIETIMDVKLLIGGSWKNSHLSGDQSSYISFYFKQII